MSKKELNKEYPNFTKKEKVVFDMTNKSSKEEIGCLLNLLYSRLTLNEYICALEHIIKSFHSDKNES